MFFSTSVEFSTLFSTGSLIQAVRRLVQTSVLQSDFLWLDDVYITGILASKAGVPLISVEVEQYLFISLCNNELYISDRISMSRETPPPPCQPRPSIQRNIRSREVWITSCTGPGTATLWTGKHSVLIWFLWPSICLCLDFDTEQYSWCQTNGLIH